jgi:hypothetical protein
MTAGADVIELLDQPLRIESRTTLQRIEEVH